MTYNVPSGMLNSTIPYHATGIVVLHSVPVFVMIFALMFITLTMFVTDTMGNS